MKTLPSTARKAEEIAHYNDFLVSLAPGTYLHSMFARTGGRVENEIRNDIAIGPVEDVVKEREKWRKELAELAKKKADLEFEIRALKNSSNRLAEGVAALKAQAARLAGM